MVHTSRYIYVQVQYTNKTVYINIYLNACIHTDTYIHVHTPTHIHARTYAYMHINTHNTHTHTCMHPSMHTSILFTFRVATGLAVANVAEDRS